MPTADELRRAVLAALKTEADRVSTKRHLGQYIQEETGWYYKAVARVAQEMKRCIEALDLTDTTPEETVKRIRFVVTGRDELFGWGGNWSDSAHRNAVGDLRRLVENTLGDGAGQTAKS
jgi:hypothetical protein